MKALRTFCKLLITFASAVGNAQTPNSSVWKDVPTTYSAPNLQPESLTSARLASIRTLLLARKKNLGMWECDDQSWLADLKYSRIPVASKRVLLIEAGNGCARGGQGANGAMWLVDQSGNKPRLIAAPDREFNGWLYNIQPRTHQGFHDIVLGWHMSAAEADLTYFRFDGVTYKRVSSATLVTDAAGNGKIVAKPHEN